MLECGRLDLTRARLLAEATEVLDDAHARRVQALRPAAVGDGPWDGPSPRAWRARVQRAVITVDPDSARRRRESAIRCRLVRAWAAGDGTGVWRSVAADTDIAARGPGDHRPRPCLADGRPGRGAVVHGPAPRRRGDGPVPPGRRRQRAALDAAPAASGRSGSCCTPTPSSATARPRTPPASCAASAPPPRSTRTPRPSWPEAEIARRRRHPRPARRRRRHPAAHPPPAEGTAGRLDPTSSSTDRGPQRPTGPAGAADRVLRTDRGDHRPRPRRAPPVHVL